MTASQFGDWLAYDQIEPIGAIRGDVQAGVIASTIANVHRRKGGQPFSIPDFMPFAQKPKRDLSSELKAAFKEFTNGE